MTDHEWIREFPGAITICNPQGIVLELNDKAAKVFEDDGGFAILGTNLFDCHPAEARAKLQELMDTQTANIYTIEKNGVKKLIYQTPWYKEGAFAGMIELSLEIPFEMPHFIRS